MLCDGAALQHSVFKVVFVTVFKVVFVTVFKVVLLQHRSFDHWVMSRIISRYFIVYAWRLWSLF
jgi:hypothetical protein